MNEKTEAAPQMGLEEAPDAVRSAAPIEQPEPRFWRPEELRFADLRGEDLTQVEGVLPEHLVGADLTGAKLPEDIAKFPALGRVAAISSQARKIFIGLLAACVYSWLVIATTEDVQLIVNTATSPLPIINTPIPIAGFYVVGAALLAAVYFYLHLYLHRLWRTLATLPAFFPDGTALDDGSDPWLLTNFVRAHFEHLKRKAHPLAWLENQLSVLLAWWLVPLSVVALWVRYLPRHDIEGLLWLALVFAATTFFGVHTFRLARATLRGEVRPVPKVVRERPQRLALRVLRDARWPRPSQGALGYLLPWIVISAFSLTALWQSPRNAEGEIVAFSLSEPWESLRQFDKSLAGFLNLVGIRTYANLREVNVAEPSEGWDGKDWSKVKRVDLRGRNLAFADASGAFLANADLRNANLKGAILEYAQLQGASLEGAQLHDAILIGVDLRGAGLRRAQLKDADLSRAQLLGATMDRAELQGAILRGAELQDADLSNAQLQSAILHRAQLQGAALRGAELQGADLYRANLRGATLYRAQLQGAILRGADLQGADLEESKLLSADLLGAQLQGAALGGAELHGADMQEAHLQGADLAGAQLQGADLSGAHLNGASIRRAQLQGAFLRSAELHGADLRGAGLWRAVLPHQADAWHLADVRGFNVSELGSRLTPPEELLDRWFGAVEQDIPEPRRGLMAKRLKAAILGKARMSRPVFPLEWRSQPTIMFEADDPNPEPFDWGQRKWATEAAYDEDLAKYLGDLACGSNVPEAQTRGLALRALDLASANRLYQQHLAVRITGSDCPPAKGLPEEVHRRLEQLAARDYTSAADSGASEPDPAE